MMYRVALIFCQAVVLSALLFVPPARSQTIPPTFVEKQILNSLPNNGTALGIRYNPASMNPAGDGRVPIGYRIDSILETSPLHNQATAPGDVIYSIDWLYFESTEETKRYVNSLEPGQRVEIIFWRAVDGKNLIGTFRLPGNQSLNRCTTSQSNRADYSQKIKDLIVAANDGLPSAQYEVSKWHKDIPFAGNDYNVDDATAICWLKLAARSGSVAAQHDLAEEYALGYRYIEKNYFMAAFWYTKAANRGDMQSVYKLGLMYVNGDGVRKNKELGYKFILLVADSGNTYAMSYSFCNINIDWEYKKKVGC